LPWLFNWLSKDCDPVLVDLNEGSTRTVDGFENVALGVAYCNIGRFFQHSRDVRANVSRQWGWILAAFAGLECRLVGERIQLVLTLALENG